MCRKVNGYSSYTLMDYYEHRSVRPPKFEPSVVAGASEASMCNQPELILPELVKVIALGVLLCRPHRYLLSGNLYTHVSI